MDANRLLHHGNEQQSSDESDIDDAYVKAELDELDDIEVEELGDSEFETILKKRGKYGLIEKKKLQPKSLRLIKFVLCLAILTLGFVIGRLFFKPSDHSDSIEQSEKPDLNKILKDLDLLDIEPKFDEQKKAEKHNVARIPMLTQEDVNINKRINPRIERNRDPRIERNRDPRTRTNRELEKRTHQMSRGRSSNIDRINALRSQGRSRYGWNSLNTGVRTDPRMGVDRRPHPKSSNDLRAQQLRQLANERNNKYNRDLKVHGRTPSQKRGRTQTSRNNYRGRTSSIPRSNIRSSRPGRSPKTKPHTSARTRPQRIKLPSSVRG